MALSNGFKSLYALICFVGIPSYYVCDIIVLCCLFLPTVIIRLKEFY